MKIGMHAGPQDLSIEELKRLWKVGDANGFHWISVWDHFYANPLRDRNNPCFEGVAAMAGLAAATTNVRVGCLVFCALFRSPGMLAKSAVTIDHLSGGRAEIGIGAGWFEEEFREFGYGFPPLGKRLDQLEEALTIIRSLWHDEETNFKGEYYEIKGAVCSPKPVNPLMRLWIGGRGKRRTPRLAARYGDGFNMPYLPPTSVADRLRRVRAECEAVNRDPDEIETSVNVGFYMNSKRAPEVNPEGSLVGNTQQTVDRIGEYSDSGVNGLNIAFRPPVDWDALDAFIEDVMPVFADGESVDDTDRSNK
ncbi:MAG: TIGR03560 family F420-dependent LLM class oxidoreductase [Gammaproteobacteria bacterium]|nr:TIGR03560 family F420-dependent LLM class oxidoreductase [Gammaproteobacteria bacterium]